MPHLITLPWAPQVFLAVLDNLIVTVYSCYGNHSLQVLLLNAVRDVANALSNLIDTTRAASGKSVNDPSMERLKTSAKVSDNYQVV